MTSGAMTWDFGAIRFVHLMSINCEQMACLSTACTRCQCARPSFSVDHGRYAPRFGLQHQVIWPGAPGDFSNETTLAEHLKASGYSTAAVGKYHMGLFKWEHTPTFRGFDSFLCFFGGGEDYFTHMEGPGSESPGPKLGSGFDMWFQDRPRCAEGCARDLANNRSKHSSSSSCNKVPPSMSPAAAGSGSDCVPPPFVNGKYSTELFGSRAVQVIEEHEPLHS